MEYVRPASANALRSEHCLSPQGALTLEWEVERHLTFVGTYSHFFPGGFLEQSGLGEHVDFVALWAAYRV